MKRVLTIIGALLVCALVFSVLIIPVSAETVTYLRGDADGNGVITIDDASLIQRVKAGLTSDSDGAVARRGDVNGNGLSVMDATLIQNYLAQNSDRFGVGQEVTQVITEPTMPFSVDPYELPFIR